MPLWNVLNGTLINTAAVLAGSTLGLLCGVRLAETYRRAILSALGLVTLALGADAAVLHFARTTDRLRATLHDPDPTLPARLALIVVASLLLGALLGTALRLQQRVEHLGGLLHRLGGPGHPHAFARGFLAASVLFCVGPLTLLGCLHNGAHHDPTLLLIKSLMDGFSSLALAATLGAGVLASALFVLVFQSALALAAAALGLTADSLGIDLMTATGGYLLLATGLVILEIRALPVADYLPAIFLPPALLALVRWFVGPWP